MMAVSRMLPYVMTALVGVFVSSVGQVLLKKSANKTYSSPLREYINPLVIMGYVLFVGSTLLSVYAYKGIPLSMGEILDATGYVYVTFFGVTVFHEHVDRRKVLSLCLIVAGIAVYATGI